MGEINFIYVEGLLSVENKIKMNFDIFEDSRSLFLIVF